MTLCLRKGRKVEHTPEFLQAFNLCKQLLCNDPILKYPDFHKTFTVTSDASNYSIGAVLCQDNKPVCFASRTPNPNEINYSAIEKELLSIIWAVKYFRPYLFGRHFKIRTDHKPLKWLHSLKDPSSKLVRWKLLLSDLITKLITSRVENVVADALSRNPPDNTSIINETGDIDDTIQDFIKESENYATTTIHTAQEMPVLTFPILINL
ncbi:hypothetical protein JTB14_003338 [Gonioctena quinquepunctata]|nr:hypothetical protein JTB14_003338 [Gonioctena quinquepunctata]